MQRTHDLAARRLGITRKTLRKKLEKYESANEG